MFLGMQVNLKAQNNKDNNYYFETADPKSN